MYGSCLLFMARLNMAQFLFSICISLSIFLSLKPFFPFLIPFSSPQCFSHGYDEIDYEGLHTRFIKTHRRCFPVGQYDKPKPLPVPRSCRLPLGAPSTDHQHCYTLTPMLPPIGSWHRVADPWAEGGSLSFFHSLECWCRYCRSAA